MGNNLASVNRLTRDDVRRDFVYNPDEGTLIWNTFSGSSTPGDTAGWLDKYGYVRVRYRRKIYFAAQLIYLHMRGNIPDGMEIDHINRIPNDNRWDNLRLVTRSQNKRNRVLCNKTGLTGVSKASPNRWTSCIKLGDRRRRLGLFTTPKQAHNAYLFAASLT